MKLRQLPTGSVFGAVVGAFRMVDQKLERVEKSLSCLEQDAIPVRLGRDSLPADRKRLAELLESLRCLDYRLT